MKHNIYYLVAIVFFLPLSSCNDNKNLRRNKIKYHEEKQFVIDLYNFDSVYMKYMPDTALNFPDLKSLYKYRKIIYSKFDSVGNSFSNNNDLKILNRRAATIQMDNLMEVLYYKVLTNAKKDIEHINLVSLFSPNSNLISLQQRIDLFNSYPEGVRNSTVGKKVWSTIREYTFDNLTGFDFMKFSNTHIKDSSFSVLSLHSILQKKSKYTIIILGASWCAPCRLDELQFKYWIPLIDTNIVSVIGLSVDTDEKKWKSYLKNDNLPWRIYLLPDGMDNKIVKDLDMRSIPMNLVLDGNLKIVAQNTDIRKVLKQIPGLPVTDD